MSACRVEIGHIGFWRVSFCTVLISAVPVVARHYSSSRSHTAVPVVARHYSSSRSHTSQHFVWLKVCAGCTSIQEELLRLRKPIWRAAKSDVMIDLFRICRASVVHVGIFEN